MSKPVPLQDSWSLGFKRDQSRDQLPRGSCYDALNVLPDMEAPIRKRGGWGYEGVTFTDHSPLSGLPLNVSFSPFTAGSKVAAIEDSAANHLIDVTSGVDRGAAQASLQAPFFYRNLLIIPSNGAGTPMKWAGGAAAPAALGGTPPVSHVGAVYKDRLLLAAGADALGFGTQNRVYFSGAGNPESWDTTTRWMDTSAYVSGLAALRNALVVFHPGSVERIRGSIPPGSAAFDMTLEPLFNEVGLYGPNSFAISDDSVIWADEDGIYQTDGASFSDLTKQGGIKKYWIDQVAAAGASATIAVGTWKGYATVSLLSAAGGYIDFLLCDVQSRSWFRANNIRTKNFASRFGSTDELYFSNQSEKRIGTLASIFTPATGNKADGNAASVLPRIDTAFFGFEGKGRKRILNAYLGYDLRATAGGETVSVGFATTPEATTYTSTTSLPTTTSHERRRVPIRRSASGFSLRISSLFSTDDFKLYSLEADTHPLEGSRRG